MCLSSESASFVSGVDPDTRTDPAVVFFSHFLKHCEQVNLSGNYAWISMRKIRGIYMAGVHAGEQIDADPRSSDQVMFRHLRPVLYIRIRYQIRIDRIKSTGIGRGVCFL